MLFRSMWAALRESLTVTYLLTRLGVGLAMFIFGVWATNQAISNNSRLRAGCIDATLYAVAGMVVAVASQDAGKPAVNLHFRCFGVVLLSLVLVSRDMTLSATVFDPEPSQDVPNDPSPISSVPVPVNSVSALIEGMLKVKDVLIYVLAVIHGPCSITQMCLLVVSFVYIGCDKINQNPELARIWTMLSAMYVPSAAFFHKPLHYIHANGSGVCFLVGPVCKCIVHTYLNACLILVIWYVLDIIIPFPTWMRESRGSNKAAGGQDGDQAGAKRGDQAGDKGGGQDGAGAGAADQARGRRPYAVGMQVRDKEAGPAL